MLQNNGNIQQKASEIPLYCGDKIHFHCRGNLKSHQKTQLPTTTALCSDQICDGSFVVSAFVDIPNDKKFPNVADLFGLSQ
jgi:hypothetical protein